MPSEKTEDSSEGRWLKVSAAISFALVLFVAGLIAFPQPKQEPYVLGLVAGVLTGRIMGWMLDD